MEIKTCDVKQSYAALNWFVFHARFFGESSVGEGGLRRKMSSLTQSAISFCSHSDGAAGFRHKSL